MINYNRHSIEMPPEPPKKALCAFFLYRQDVYEFIKKESPNARITEITKIIGEMWKQIDPQLKERYEMEYNINREDAARARQDYESQWGRQSKSRKSKKVKRALKQIKSMVDRGVDYYN